jgi:hypothetical protein
MMVKMEAVRKADQEHITEKWKKFCSLSAKLDAWRKEVQANREARKAMDLKANPEEMESESEHREVPKEDAVVKPVKGRKKRH